MIIINLKGGLGNQMFQYALGRHFSIKNNDTLKLDTAGLSRANVVGDIYRPFSLDAFHIQKTIATEAEVRALKYPNGVISKGKRWFNFKILKKTNTVFDAKVLERTGDMYLDGYWQSPRFFDDIRPVLLEDFTLLSPLGATGEMFATTIRNSNAISIHVRRGDYIKNPQVQKEFGICSVDYYQKAIAHIQANTDSPQYFVFSDDIDWVRENLNLGEQSIFVSDPTITDAQELYLMSLCHHNIIANSTFSWWGAWLNQHPDKIVIAPTPWFENQPYDNHLIPNSWTLLPK